MMNRARHIRLAVLGSSPCSRCDAACCRQNGHEFAVLLRDDELRRFAPWSVDVAVQSTNGVVVERVIAYRDGRCPFLGEDNRCTIYEDRPISCRQFECVKHFNERGLGLHGRFLDLNPRVLELLQSW
jgi:Fe-S-cluster containining protein